MRVCSVLGCGQPLVTKTGAPDFRRYFCSREHRNQDRKEKMQSRRRSIPGKRCRLCGRLPIQNACVSEDNAHESGHRPAIAGATAGGEIAPL